MRTGPRQRMRTTSALPAEDVADAPDAAVAGLAAVAACRQVNVSARIVSEEEGAVGATFVKGFR